MLFHSPQLSQRPAHFGLAAPQLWQTWREVGLGKSPRSRVGGQHRLSTLPISHRANDDSPCPGAQRGRVLTMSELPFLRVVGVAKQGIYTYWAEPALEAVWTPYSQDYNSQMYIEIRTAADAAAFAAVVREQVHALDPDMPIFRISTIATFFRDRAMLEPRLIAQIVTVPS